MRHNRTFALGFAGTGDWPEVALGATLLLRRVITGDQTTAWRLLLATRFRKPVPIVLGIFVATLAKITRSRAPLAAG